MSGMKLIGSLNKPELTGRDRMEQCYDEVPYHHKEMAGLPLRYYDLSVEQRFFVDSFYETSYNVFTNEPFVREELEHLHTLVNEIEDTAKNVYNSLRGE